MHKLIISASLILSSHVSAMKEDSNSVNIKQMCRRFFAFESYIKESRTEAEKERRRVSNVVRCDPVLRCKPAEQQKREEEREYQQFIKDFFQGRG